MNQRVFKNLLVDLQQELQVLQGSTATSHQVKSAKIIKTAVMLHQSVKIRLESI